MGRRSRGSCRRSAASGSAYTRGRGGAAELLLDPLGVEPAGGEEDIAVEPEVGKLLDEPLVRVRDGGERRLDALLPHLLRRRGDALVEERRRRRSLPAASRRARRRRATATARSTTRHRCGRPGRRGRRAAGSRRRRSRPGSRRRPACSRGRALVPVLLPRAAPEPGLAALAGAPERLLVHPGEHRGRGRSPRPGRSRAVSSPGSQPHVPSRLPQLGLQLGQPLGPLVHDRGDDRRLGSDARTRPRCATPARLRPRRSPAPRPPPRTRA